MGDIATPPTRKLLSTPISLSVDAWYCDVYNPVSLLMENTSACVPTEAEVRAWNIEQMATTKMTPENQQAAVDWSDNVLAADRRQNPDMYCASDAVTQSPMLSQIFGPEMVCKVGSANGLGMTLLIGAAAVVGIGVVLSMAKR